MAAQGIGREWAKVSNLPLLFTHSLRGGTGSTVSQCSTILPSDNAEEIIKGDVDSIEGTFTDTKHKASLSKDPMDFVV